MFWSALFFSALVQSQPASHQVLSLPGFPAFTNFDMYSGYLNIPNSLGKQLHYVLYTSQNNPKTDPLVLWLNGGPGCSSMEGAFMENGPFVFSESNSTQYVNPYSWNQIANMLYIEAPAGVGYSVLGDISNNHTNDNITANDNVAALVSFFALFPDLIANDFYIAGESYAGVYVPSLAYFIQQYNAATPAPPAPINLKGFMVGNPVTDWNVDTDSVWPQFLYWHSLIDDSIFFPWVNLNCSLLWDSAAACDPLADRMYSLFTEINYYDIYRECIPSQIQDRPARTRWLGERLQGISNCIPNDALLLYLNTPRIRSILHINNTIGAWDECANLQYDSDMVLGSYYLYPTLIASGIRINVYSGDTDSCVPTEGTRTWINNLGLTTVVDWAEWNVDGQVAGFYMRYGQNFRFNTIRGTGHMCIQWKRPQGFAMFQNFLLGKDLV